MLDFDECFGSLSCCKSQPLFLASVACWILAQFFLACFLSHWLPHKPKAQSTFSLHLSKALVSKMSLSHIHVVLHISSKVSFWCLFHADHAPPPPPPNFPQFSRHTTTNHTSNCSTCHVTHGVPHRGWRYPPPSVCTSNMTSIIS